MQIKHLSAAAARRVINQLVGGGGGVTLLFHPPSCEDEQQRDCDIPQLLALSWRYAASPAAATVQSRAEEDGQRRGRKGGRPSLSNCKTEQSLIYNNAAPSTMSIEG